AHGGASARAPSAGTSQSPAVTEPSGAVLSLFPDAEDAWGSELRHAVRTAAELAGRLRLTAEEMAGALAAERAGLPLFVTPYYLSLVDPDDPTCPIRRQVVPHADEAKTVPGDLVDPLGEQAHEAAPELVVRY